MCRSTLFIRICLIRIDHHFHFLCKVTLTNLGRKGSRLGDEAMGNPKMFGGLERMRGKGMRKEYKPLAVSDDQASFRVTSSLQSEDFLAHFTS